MDFIQYQNGIAEFTPLEPINAAGLPDYGAPLVLRGKQGLRLRATPGSIIKLNAHGNGLLIQDCHDCVLDGFTFVGSGILKEPKSFYYALILLAGSNSNLIFRNFRVFDSGDHGFGHLVGPRDTSYCVWDNCYFARGGHLAPPNNLYMDGAAIACGGHHNRIVNCRFEEWVRFVEWESGAGLTQVPTNCNQVLGCLMERPYWQAVCITPNNGRADLYEQNVIANTIMRGWGTDPKPMGVPSSHEGIYISGSTGLSVTGCTIADMFNGCGIRLNPVHGSIADCSFTSLDIRRAGKVGIYRESTNDAVFPVERNLIANNHIVSPGSRGIWINGKDNVVSGNILDSCPMEGCFDDEPGQNFWWNNRSINCGIMDRIAPLPAA